jgi:hypothetical protein
VRRFRPDLIVAAVATVGPLYVASRSFGLGFPLDDAWIHMVYGDALARHGTLAYNDGIAATGSTAPLWTVVAAVAHVVAGGPAPSMSAAFALKVFGVLFHVLAALLAMHLAQALVRRRGKVLAGLCAGALVAVVPPTVYGAVSGMEVPLASALLLAAPLFAIHRRAWLAGAAAGLAVATRPEAAVVVPFVCAMVALDSGRRVARTLVTLSGAVVPPAAILIRNQLVSGRPLPATFYAKADLSRPALEALRVGFVDTLGSVRPVSSPILWGLVATALVFGAHAARRAAHVRRVTVTVRRGGQLTAITAAALAYAAGASLVMQMKIPYEFYYQRYVLPCVPLLVVASVVAITLSVDATRARWHLALAMTVLTAMFGFEVADLPRQRDVYAYGVGAANSIQVKIGKFIAEQLPKDAVVWSVDAGAVRYFGRRRVVDLMRLNTPDLIHDGKVRKGWWPDSIVVVPSVFTATASPPLVVALVARVDGDPNPGSVQTQVVYRCGSGAVPGDPENKVGVSALGRFIAVGRCARAEDPP